MTNAQLTPSDIELTRNTFLYTIFYTIWYTTLAPLFRISHTYGLVNAVFCIPFVHHRYVAVHLNQFSNQLTSVCNAFTLLTDSDTSVKSWPVVELTYVMKN